MKRPMMLVAVIGLMAAGNALARNIDLVTLPPRAKVQLTIYNSEDLTPQRDIVRGHEAHSGSGDRV